MSVKKRIEQLEAAMSSPQGPAIEYRLAKPAIEEFSGDWKEYRKLAIAALQGAKTAKELRELLGLLQLKTINLSTGQVKAGRGLTIGELLDKFGLGPAAREEGE